MCTCIAFRQKGLYFGRNMDLDYNFGEKIAVTPRSFCLKSIGNKEHLGFIGVATVIDGYPLYADAMNEKGLCIAGLNFPQKSFYRELMADKINVPAYEFTAYVAAKYSSVGEFRDDFGKINITNQAFSENVPAPTLHWMISDNLSSIVVESTELGINLYENPLNTMTNLPEFPEHLESFRKMRSEEGSVPEDFPVLLSSPSRFLRVAHFLGNILPETNSDGAISHVFHVLDTVAVPDVSAKALNGNYHKTTYSACLDTVNLRYLIRTYENSAVACAGLTEEALVSSDISIFEISHKQNYIYLN